MASLSTCHLGLWLGWQILLNLVKSCLVSSRVGSQTHDLLPLLPQSSTSSCGFGNSDLVHESIVAVVVSYSGYELVGAVVVSYNMDVLTGKVATSRTHMTT